MAIGAPGAAAPLELWAAEVPDDGVEPGTSSTEPATVSTLVPIHHARAITTANARMPMPKTANRRRAPGTSAVSRSVLPVSAYGSARYPASVQPSSCSTASRSSEVDVHGSAGG